MKKSRKSHGREGNLLLRQKKYKNISDFTSYLFDGATPDALPNLFGEATPNAIPNQLPGRWCNT